MNALKLFSVGLLFLFAFQFFHRVDPLAAKIGIRTYQNRERKKLLPDRVRQPDLRSSVLPGKRYPLEH